MTEYTQGQIVDVFIPDLNGFNPKTRPVIILSDTEGLSENDQILVVAITTKHNPNRIKPEEVVIPYGENCKTGRDKPGVANCKWLVRIQINEIQRLRGFLPGKQFEKIIDIIYS